MRVIGSVKAYRYLWKDCIILKEGCVSCFCAIGSSLKSIVSSRKYCSSMPAVVQILCQI
jgi:hypothetical protein